MTTGILRSAIALIWMAGVVLPAQTPPVQTPPVQGPPVQPPTQGLPIPAPSPAAPAAPQPPFADWVAALRSDALARGISTGTFDAAFLNLAPDPVVVARDRTQPEETLSLDEYVTRRLSTKTIASAAQMFVEHRTLLAKVNHAYGVPPAVMIAIWGLESNFGQFTGSYAEIASLATLAYDSRRPDLFRSELFEALRILDRGLVPADALKGSWAGAMGQPQFMPSNYLKYAVDFDADGRADIWTSTADVFASIGNYLQHAGWTPDRRWGREVAISPAVMARIDKGVPMRQTGCKARKQMTEPRPLTEWRKLGVRLAGGGRLPVSTLNASLVRGEHRHFLVYDDYEALLSYNCSNWYAIAVGLLADRVAAAPRRGKD